MYTAYTVEYNHEAYYMFNGRCKYLIYYSITLFVILRKKLGSTDIHMEIRPHVAEKGS